MTIAALLAFTLAAFVIVIVPGPTLTVIIANSIRDGARAGFLNIAGTQAGLAVMVLVVALGLETFLAVMSEWFHVIKLAGAAYLVWLGIRLLRSNGEIGSSDSAAPRIGYFWQGFLVILSNPKVLLLFGAVFPQFIDPSASAFWQTILLGAIFMAVATVFDSLYALLAGSARGYLTRNRIRLVERLSGTLLIAGGVWMALLRRA